MSTWDAVETAWKIRKGEVSAREVLDAAIARAEAAGSLNAVVTETYERARAREAKGPLGGVPTFTKDLAEIAGVATTWGSRGSGSYVSRRTHPIVGRLEVMGLVSLGKSATPEMGLTATTEPMGRPPTRNPWDPTRSPGGSSGGAAALVAAGVVPIAHASDGGGSIRIPASCCGLVGLKPTRGRIDMEGSNLLPVNVAVEGVVTRSVRDTIAFHAALEAQRVPAGMPPIGGERTSSTKPLRIGVFTDAPAGTPVDAEVREAARKAGEACRELGHEVDEIACPFDAQFTEDFLAYWGLVAWLQVRSARVAMHGGFDTSKCEPWTHGIAGTFSAHRRATLAATMRLRRFGETYAKVFERYDVLVSPTIAELPSVIGHLATDQPFEAAYAKLRAYAPFTPIQNAAGAPAVSLPLGRSSGGVPIGVQFAGARGADRVLLDLALALEEARPWEKIAPVSAWYRS